MSQTATIVTSFDRLRKGQPVVAGERQPLRLLRVHLGVIQLSIGQSAAQRGGELLKMGLTVGQVVQDYGNLCQSVTELAAERDVSITADDFQTFNRCLDDAVAQAVTEYEHQRDRQHGGVGTEQLGALAHEMRNMVTTAMLTFDALQGGIVGVHGRTSALLSNSLQRMSALLDRTILDVRSKNGKPTAERVSVAAVLGELTIMAAIEAKDRKFELKIDAGDATRGFAHRRGAGLCLARG